MFTQQEIRDYLVACESFLNDGDKRLRNGLPLEFLYTLRQQLLDKLLAEQLRTFNTGE